MKLNKWTLGLAAVGVVSLASAVKAEERMSAIQSALTSTIISGYVDTSFEWQIKPDRELPDFDSWPSIPFRTESKMNGFNLNVVKLSFEKPLDEGEWASGYKIDLLAGPDAVNYNTSVEATGGRFGVHTGDTADFAIKQAYVALRTPVGNGIDWKIGVFDTILGYESFESGNNPNFTRSWGWALEPTQHTGLLGTYKFTEDLSFSAGVANTHMAGINNRNDENGTESFWRKTWMASLAYTAPESAGALKGSTFYAGAMGGFAGGTQDQYNIYLGATIATPVTGLKVGAAFDWVENLGGNEAEFTYSDDVWVAGLYASYQATEKLSLHGRFEYGNLYYKFGGIPDTGDERMWSITGTVQYDLWANVISRLELRYDDMQADGDFGYDYEEQHLGLFVNVIYKF